MARTPESFRSFFIIACFYFVRDDFFFAAHWLGFDLIRTTTMFVARFVISRSSVRIRVLAVLIISYLQPFENL